MPFIPHTEDDINAHTRRIASARGMATRGHQYEQYMDRVKWAMASGDTRVRGEWDRANKGIVALRNKDIAPGAVHQNATLANMSVQYANEMYIGEELLPTLQVAKASDVYYTYGQRDRLAYPDDELGPRSQANEIQETRATSTYACVPYGYQNFVSAMTLANQDAPLNEMVDLTEAILEGLAFRREQRQATVMCTSSNYGANTAAIGAANRWNTVGGGDPIANIQTGMAAIWQGRGPADCKMFTSLNVYQILSRHQAILDLFKYNGSSPGLATPDMIARWFECSQLLVGKARQDTANEGTAANYTRMWTDVLGIVRVAKRASTRNAVFGYTFQHGAPITQQWFDERVGHGGGYYSKVSRSEVIGVVAPLTSYLITTPV